MVDAEPEPEAEAEPGPEPEPEPEPGPEHALEPAPMRQRPPKHLFESRKSDPAGSKARRDARNH